MIVSLFGQWYKQASPNLNPQEVTNLYPIVDQNQAISPTALRHTEGLINLGTSASGLCRGVINYNGTIYAVCGANFVKHTFDTMTNTFTETVLGTLNTSTGHCYIVGNATQIMVMEKGGPYGYIFTPADSTFTQITDGNFLNPNTLITLDNYFVVSQKDSIGMIHCDVADGFTWDALNFANASSTPDNIVGLAVLKGEIWVFKEHGIEVWYDAGNATAFAFSPRSTSLITRGCSAARSICNINDQLAWLDDRLYILLSNGYSYSIISNDVIQKELAQYPTVDDAYFYNYQATNGHEFLCCSFPSGGVTWVYDISTALWHKRTSYVNTDYTRHLSGYVVRLNNTSYNICYSWFNNTVYKMDDNTYTEDGVHIQRLVVLPTLTADHKRIGVADLHIYQETGDGLQSGQGSDPVMQLEISKDSGHTYGPPIMVPLGPAGEYKSRAIYRRLGSARQMTFRLIITDPIPVNLVSVSVSIDTNLTSAMANQ